MIYFELFFGFLKVGCFAFGGAYGAIPLIRDVVLSYGWLSDDALTDMIAVSEMTPGPIMVNLATYVGSSKAGLPGAALATLAVVLPSFFVILLLMAALKNTIKNKYVQAVLRGLKPCVIGIVLATGIFMIFRNCFPGFATGAAAGSAANIFSGNDMSVLSPNMRNLAVTAVLLLIFYGSRFLKSKSLCKHKVSPILLIILSACIGVLVLGF